MEGYIGVIIPFAGNFAPTNWLFCNGQTINIAQYQALYAIVGNSFGPSTQTTFTLPDLRGRMPISQGTGPGLTPFARAQYVGAQAATMQAANLPTHNHTGASTGSFPVGTSPDTDTPGPGTFIGPIPGGFSATKGTGGVMTAPTFSNIAVQSTGAAGIPVMQPFTAVYHIICALGYFPPRN